MRPWAHGWLFEGGPPTCLLHKVCFAAPIFVVIFPELVVLIFWVYLSLFSCFMTRTGTGDGKATEGLSRVESLGSHFSVVVFFESKPSWSVPTPLSVNVKGEKERGSLRERTLHTNDIQRVERFLRKQKSARITQNRAQLRSRCSVCTCVPLCGPVALLQFN